MNSRAWIFKPSVDLAFIILPGIASVLFLFTLKKLDILPSEINPWTWFCTVLLIDVAHVYSTLFRSYFNEEEWKRKNSFDYCTDRLFFIFGPFVFLRSNLVLENHVVRCSFSFYTTTVRISGSLSKKKHVRPNPIFIR
ncbi:hypothetical protein LEP1GSC137_3062 [Leptospira borgpetersenii str. Noumea 25]|nr:hypothetical protein LEP1GSC137_3062 [Leptospira borgpetersenii str. Noumea 25]